MTPLHHRQPGVVGAALYFDDLFCEFAKQTGQTVRHEVFDIVYRLKGSSAIIHTTDCLGTARRTDPSYHYVRKLKYTPMGHQLKQEDEHGHLTFYAVNDYDSIRHLEMSYLTSVKTMQEHTQMNWMDIAAMTSANPARYIHIDDRYGAIKPMYKASLTILNDQFELLETVVDGRREYIKKQ